MEKQFNILLAGVSIGICPLYSDIEKMCKDYLTDKEPEFVVTISEEDIEFEKVKSDREAEVEGRKPATHSPAYLETLAVYRKISTELVNYNVLLFHGSVISVDGEGYLFTAKSGTGKSTHTKLWREMFKERAIMINDDKPLLEIREDGVFAYGTPWDGKHHLSTNTSVKLKAVCEITRSETNQIAAVDKKSIFPLLCQQSFRPANPEGMMKAMTLITDLSKNVSLYRLGCNMDMEAAEVAYKGMA